MQVETQSGRNAALGRLNAFPSISASHFSIYATYVTSITSVILPLLVLSHFRLFPPLHILMHSPPLHSQLEPLLAEGKQ